MPVASLVLEVRMPGLTTARARAEEAKGILVTIKKHFNVSVADLGPGREAPGESSALGFASVAKTRREAREMLDLVAEAVAAHPRVEILKAAYDAL